MYTGYTFVKTDEQRAQFASFFIQHKEQFSKELLLRQAIIYILSCIDYCTIMFTFNEKQQLMGTVNCWPADEQHSYDKEGTILFISSAIITAEERSTRTFLRGFRDLIKPYLINMSINIRYMIN